MEKAERDTGLLEEFSKKPKRGRPRVLHEKLEAVYRQKTGSYCSPRTVQNFHYELRAFQLLGFAAELVPQDSPLRWLCGNKDEHVEGQSSRKLMKSTILCELGRIENPVVMLACAKRICAEKPKTRDAIVYLRRVRQLGRSRPADTDSLVTELARCIDEYKHRHPDLTNEQVMSALNEVYGYAAAAEYEKIAS